MQFDGTVILSNKYRILNPFKASFSKLLLSVGSAPYWSNPPFLIFDIRALWRSVLSVRAPECQKLKMVGQTSMTKCKALTGLAVKGLIALFCLYHRPLMLCCRFLVILRVLSRLNQYSAALRSSICPDFTALVTTASASMARIRSDSI